MGHATGQLAHGLQLLRWRSGHTPSSSPYRTPHSLIEGLCELQQLIGAARTDASLTSWIKA
jgi:hypothetical protein